MWVQKKRKILLFFLLANITAIHAQLAVSNSVPYNTANYLVQNVLLGSGVQVSNITYAGNALQIGYFNGINSNINLDSGIIITSGDIVNAVGPNNIGSAGTDNSGYTPTPNPDLEQLANAPSDIYDPADLEFDFVSNADTVKFEYVFGSEEYMEWVSAGFNDAFGFFLSGPGISGPYSNNAANIALIPNTSTPVTIDNVNALSNAAYYFDNENPPGVTVQYDGFTKVLTAIAAVQCGQTYHIKLAIGDAGDGIYDSGVFLKAGSFSSSGNITVSSTINYGNLNDSTLFEGCGQACIIIDRGQSNISNPDTVTLNFTGTATNGVDITQLPDTVFFAPGQDSITICINGIVDVLTEGPEAMTMLAVLLGNSACSSGDSASLTLYIDDHTPLSITAAADSTICPGDTIQLIATPTGGIQPIVFSWTPASGLSNSSIPNPTASPTVTTTYVVSVSDSCFAPFESDSVIITVLPPGPVVANSSDVTLCLDGTPITLSASVSGGAVPYTYLWTTVSGNDSVNPATSQNPMLVPTGPGVYMVTVSDFCGNVNSDNATVYTEDCVTIIPNVISADGSGWNDYFSIKNLDKFPNSRLVIYNRWGNKIYDDPDYKNNWDAHGYVDGTYYFILYRSDGKEFPGYLTVLR